ncbi:MAG: hemerythrin [Candidatus Zixiibacteriota bacterium]|nr:MAG: hemerythrin [candidate division Zixibacteria bacterium]
MSRRPTDILSEEHRVIEVMLACVERITAQAREGGKLDKEAASQAVDFIRNYADKCHHAKEEDQLFPAMTAKGIPSQGGPVAVMLAEHDQGRAFVRGMADNLEAAAEGDAQALEQFARNALGYVGLLRDHIYKEDNILYPMANNVFADEDQQRLLDIFDKVEKEHIGEGVHERYVAMARQMAKKYGLTEV